MFQMAVKVINDIVQLNGPVPTLLVCGAYPRMTNLDPPMPSISQGATAIKKAMQEIVKFRAKLNVNDALSHRNGPSTTILHNPALNSDVLVWREGNYKNQACVVGHLN